MTDSDDALRFDALLDQLGRGGSATGELGETARTMQELDRSQRVFPSDAFRTQLRAQLMEGAPMQSLNGHHPVALATLSAPMPVRPVARSTSHRWLAIAAALLLLLAGGGAIVLEGFGLRDDPEPSAIPAASLASPTSERQAATSPQAGTANVQFAPQVPMALSGGTLYRIEQDSGDAAFTGLRAYRTSDSKRLWEIAGDDFGSFLVADGDLVFTTSIPEGSGQGQIVAYEENTGDIAWSMDSGGVVTGLSEDDGVVYAVDSTGSVAAFDAESGDLRWATVVDEQVATPTQPMGPTLVVSPGYVSAVTASGTLVVLDRQDGEVFWSKPGYQFDSVMLAATSNMLFVTTRETYYAVADATAYAIAIPVGTIPPAGATPFSEAGGDYSFAPSEGWNITPYYLSSGGFSGSRGIAELFAPPVAIGDVIAVAGSSNGVNFDFAGQSSRDSGQVVASLPASVEGKRIVQLGVWAPPDGAPEQFVAVTEDGFLMLISPKHLGIVDNADQSDPYDGAVVDLGQPVISQSVGDENGIWLTLADGTLASIHPLRLEMSASQGTPEPANNGVTWITGGPDDMAAASLPDNAHLFDDGRVYRAFALQSSEATVVQAIDAHTGDVAWETEIEPNAPFMIGAGDALLIAGKDKRGDGHLVALDAVTGEDLWEADLSDQPVGMVVTGTTILVLGQGDTLDAIDVETGELDYTVDVHGNARDVGPMVTRDRYIPEHRVAIDGQRLYVTLGDGTVTAVDWETGTVAWQSVRSAPGQVQVFALDGAIVTVDQGDLIAIQPGVRTEVREVINGTPSAATPVASPESMFACDAGDVLSVPAALPVSTGLGGTWNAAYRGLDPDTGQLLWESTVLGESSNQIQVENGMLTILFTNKGGAVDLAYCFIDVDSGQISNVDPRDFTSSPVWRMESSSDAGVGIAPFVVIDGYVLLIPQEDSDAISATPAMVDPRADETILHSGSIWREVFEGRIYFSTVDGDLVSIPLSN